MELCLIPRSSFRFAAPITQVIDSQLGAPLRHWRAVPFSRVYSLLHLRSIYSCLWRRCLWLKSSITSGQVVHIPAVKASSLFLVIHVKSSLLLVYTMTPRLHSLNAHTAWCHDERYTQLSDFRCSSLKFMKTRLDKLRV